MPRRVLPTAGGGCGFGLVSNRPALPSLPRRGLKVGFAPRADNSFEWFTRGRAAHQIGLAGKEP